MQLTGASVWAEGSSNRLYCGSSVRSSLNSQGSNLTKVWLVLSVEAWAKSCRPAAVSGIARNPEGLAQGSFFSCRVNTPMLAHTHSRTLRHTQNFLTHMCSYTCTHIQSLSDTHALKHPDTYNSHTHTHTFLVITSETALIASVWFTTPPVLSDFQSLVPKLVVFTFTMVCQTVCGVCTRPPHL